MLASALPLHHAELFKGQPPVSNPELKSENSDTAVSSFGSEESNRALTISDGSARQSNEHDTVSDEGVTSAAQFFADTSPLSVPTHLSLKAPALQGNGAAFFFSPACTLPPRHPSAPMCHVAAGPALPAFASLTNAGTRPSPHPAAHASILNSVSQPASGRGSPIVQGRGADAGSKCSATRPGSAPLVKHAGDDASAHTSLSAHSSASGASVYLVVDPATGQVVGTAQATGGNGASASNALDQRPSPLSLASHASQGGGQALQMHLSSPTGSPSEPADVTCVLNALGASSPAAMAAALCAGASSAPAPAPAAAALQLPPSCSTSGGPGCAGQDALLVAALSQLDPSSAAALLQVSQFASRPRTPCARVREHHICPRTRMHAGLPAAAVGAAACRIACRRLPQRARSMHACMHAPPCVKEGLVPAAQRSLTPCASLAHGQTCACECTCPHALHDCSMRA